MTIILNLDRNAAPASPDWSGALLDAAELEAQPDLPTATESQIIKPAALFTLARKLSHEELLAIDGIQRCCIAALIYEEKPESAPIDSAGQALIMCDEPLVAILEAWLSLLGPISLPLDCGPLQ